MIRALWIRDRENNALMAFGTDGQIIGAVSVMDGASAWRCRGPDGVVVEGLGNLSESEACEEAEDSLRSLGYDLSQISSSR